MMSSSMKMLCTLCFVLWVLEHMGLNDSAYMAGFMLSDTLKTLGSLSLSMLTEGASYALAAGGDWIVANII